MRSHQLIKTKSLKLGFLLLLIILLSSSTPTSASLYDDVQYYYNHTEPLDVSTTISFAPTDVQAGSFDGKFVNGSVVYGTTTAEYGWIGALPLNKGYAIEHFSDAENTTNLSINFTVDTLSTDHANLSIGMSIIYAGPHWRSLAYYDFFDGPVTAGSQGNGSIQNSLVHSAYPLDNGSMLPAQSYLQLLNNTSTYYYATISAHFYKTDNSSWDDTASISMNLQGTHNPEFFELMKQRMGWYDSTTTTTTTKTSPTTTNDTPLPMLWIVAPVMLVVITRSYRKYQHR